MPIALFVTLILLDDQTGAIFAAFGTAGLLMTADFAGTWLRLLVSYAVAGGISAVALLIGWAASSSTVTAVVATAVVAFVLSFVNLFRGTLAVGAPAVLLIFIVAVSIGGTSEEVPGHLAGMLVATVVSILAALLV